MCSAVGVVLNGDKRVKGGRHLVPGEKQQVILDVFVEIGNLEFSLKEVMLCLRE
jgi:hypothetical protein